MAHRVVELLEVVEVEHDHGQRPAVALGPFTLELEIVVQPAPVEQTGEGVDLRQLLGRAMETGRFDGGGGVHGDVLDHLRLDAARLRCRQLETPITRAPTTIGTARSVADSPASTRLPSGATVEALP